MKKSKEIIRLKSEKIQRNILKVRIITRFKLFGLEQAFEEEVGVDDDLVVAMLSDGARHAASGTWSPSPMVAGTYGGLNLAISGNTWTLTPVAP